MAFGIGNFLRLGIVTTIYFNLKRVQYLKNFKGKNLKLGLGCIITEAKISNNVYIGNYTSLVNVTIGNNSYINDNAKIRNTVMGKFCSIGPGVKIVLGNHPTNMVSTHPAFYANNKPFTTFSDNLYFKEYNEVTIGNDVWIGEDVLIPGGVTIGDGAIITARAVVTKDVEPYAIVGGIPAKLIKYRFDETLRDKLLQFKWWNKNEEWLRKNYKSFFDIKDFMILINGTNY